MLKRNGLYNLVNRHTGGLENRVLSGDCEKIVNRHTGGLETLISSNTLPLKVNRHTGGLETNQLYHCKYA